MKKSIIAFIVLLLAGAGVQAQNLNPVVEVTNSYIREAGGIEKPSQLLEMPDSVLHFNLDMDYSVQNTPYRGSYEFRPYLVQLRPQVRPTGESRLYARAGAGYSLHPEALVVWNPVRTEKFRLNVFGDHHSFWGQYRNMALKDRIYQYDGTRRSGHESQSALGADALFTWVGGSLAADVQYKNIAATDLSQAAFSNNLWQLRARARSAPGSSFEYNAGTRIAYIAANGLNEFHTVTDATLGANLKGVHHVLMGVSAETVGQGDNLAANFAVLPHYLLTVGDFNMKLGVKVSFIVRSGEDFCPQSPQYVYPDVHISYDLLPENLVLYASATGGDQIVSYDKLLSLNPFIRGFDFHTDNMVTRVNARIGGRGNVASRFHYDLNVGYKWDQNAWTWGMNGDTPCMDYFNKPLHTFYVNLAAGWNSEKLDIATTAYYGYTIVPDLEGLTLFAPAPFRINAHAFYNWGGRIRAGVTVEGRSKLPGPAVIPGYVDLGVQASLQMTRTLGFWIKGGNLLNQTIQRMPLYARQGIYFTVGASLNL